MSVNVYLIPNTDLGHVEDVMPEKIRSQEFNDWVVLSREILKKKKEAAEQGRWKPTVDVSDDHKFLHPFGAEHCPALQEANGFGYLIKWPASAVFKRVNEKAWQIKPSHQRFNFYNYHTMTSFPEMGEAEAFVVNTGWMVLTPPGWSTLFKNIPNNFQGHPEGITFAEGAVRTDQATVGLQVHALLRKDAPDEIRVQRGDPMGILFPFRREETELKVVDDEAIINEAGKQATKSQQTFLNAKGRYRALYMADENPSGLYRLVDEKMKK